MINERYESSCLVLDIRERLISPNFTGDWYTIATAIGYKEAVKLLSLIED